MKLKDLLICTATGLLLCTSCIEDEAPNAEADILTCNVPVEILKREPIIQNNSITLMVKPSTDLTSQSPEFTLTAGAKIDPPSGTVRNFSAPQKYIVTSESGVWKKTYTVTFVCDEIPTFYEFEDTLVTAQSEGKYFVFAENNNGKMEWSSGNPGFRLTGVAKNAYDYPTMQDANGVIGKCVKLVTRETGFFGNMVGMPIAAGNLFMGNFDVTSALTDALKSTQFGYPFYHKPTKLTGYYKFAAGEKFMSKGQEVAGKKDIFNIYAMFYEADEEVRTLDGYFKADGYTHPNLVALAIIDNPQEASSWVRFEIPFKYNYGKAIDENKLLTGGYNVAIVFSSSADGDVFEGAPGSTLWLDQIEMFYED
ncbi:PCMD domain-containing protein [Phocaeicola sp.]